jgi:membrane protein implicated in regulation of membrane protease activity
VFPCPSARDVITRRVIACTLAVAGVGLASAARAEAVTINDPPPPGHSITVFPARDFVSASGYLDTHAYRVEVQHPLDVGGGVLVSQRRIAPNGGLLEVNHPGGACWTGTTPDIRAGDIVRVIDEDTGETDQTTVANVTARRPVQTAPDTVQGHAIGVAADGTPLPVDQLEHRLVAPNDTFNLNGRRDLRASSTPGQAGRLAYDAAGSTSWTATYGGLGAADVTRALGAQAQAVWLGRDPAAATESTVFEIGAGITGGPQAPCAAPKEILPPPLGADAQAPTVPTNVTAVVSGNNTVTLNWTDSTDNVGVVAYGIYRNGQPLFDVQNPDGSAPAPTTFTDANVPPGTYTYSVDAVDDIGNRSAAQATDPVTTAANPAPQVPVNEPPAGGKKFTLFPSRDFVTIDGYAPGETATVQVIRNGAIVASADDVIPVDGSVQVNHPGGVCWNGTTPELRTNDIVRALTYGPDGALRQIDQATVANVTVGQPVQTGPDSIEIHGTAQGHDGKPLPLAQIEQRLVSSSADPFEFNGRRTLRAPTDGTLAYDTDNNPSGEKWTATYTGLSAADVTKALAVESRVMWLGRDPLAGAELTIYENNVADPPGPAPALCTSPLEPADTEAPSTPTLTVTASGTKDVKLDWTAATDDHYVYGYRVFRNGRGIANVGSDTLTFTDTGVRPGTHQYTVAAFDSASPRGPGTTIIDQLQSGRGRPYGNFGVRAPEQPITIADTTAPSTPDNLRATVNVPDTGRPTVDLAWDASTDDVGVTGYIVFRRPVTTPVSTFTRLARVPATQLTYTDTTVALSGNYEYTVAAADAAGNQSTRAPRVPVTVAFDDVAPSAPTNVRASNWPDVHGTDVRVTWDAATDNVGVSRYGIYRDGTLIAEIPGTAQSYVDPGLAAGTYQYTVDAVDSVGNRSAPSAQDPVTVANDPPQAGRDVLVYPSRDFVSANGYPDGVYRVEVIRGRKVISRSTPVTAVNGVVEINHGGQPGCWTGVTPDIHAGDVVRVIGPDGVAEQTTTADVSSGRAIQTADDTVVIHGTAADAQGNPIPVDQLENRLVSVAANFAVNGKNSIRTPNNGTLAYDAPGSTKWTATYSGLSAADVTRAVNADSIVSWLGRNPLANNELTLAENSADVGGPATPDCTAPLEATAPLVDNAPNRVAFGQVNSTGSATQTVTLSNTGTVPLSIKDAYVAGANFPVAFTISSNTCPASLAAGASCTIDVTFTPGGDLQARTASLNVVTDAGNITSLRVPLSGTGFDPAAPTVTAPKHTVVQDSAVFVAATAAASTLPVKVTWSGGATATRYELEKSVAGGAFSSVALASATAQSATVNLALSNGAVQFRVRAGRDLPDGTVAWSAWQTGQQFTLTATDSTNAQISWGGTWTTLSSAGTWGGSVRWAQLSGDNAKSPTLAYSANSIVAVVATKGPDMGRMTVQIDSGAPTTVDLYSSTVKRAVLVCVRFGVAAGNHEVMVRPTGTRNAASTANRVELDGIVSLR